MKKSILAAFGMLCMLFAFTSCEATYSSGHYVQSGDMSTDMQANMYVQSAVVAAVNEFNATEMQTVRSDKEAISVFRKFVSDTKQKIEGLELPNPGEDTWVDLQLLNLEPEVIATERLTIK